MTDPSTIADALTESPVYVGPQSDAVLPPGRQDAVAATLQDSDVPVYIVVTKLSYDDQYRGSSGQLLALVHDELGADGVYAHVGEHGLLVSESYGYADEWEAAQVAGEEPAPADAIGRFAELVASGTGTQAYDEMQRGDVADDSTEQQQDGGSSDTSTAQPPPDDVISTATGVVTGGIVLVAVIAALVLWRQIARARHRRVAGVFDVPDHVADAVRSAQTAAVDEQARATTLALGESIDRTETATGEHAVAEYRAALDAYDAARRTLERADGLADLVGALVLAERGQAHLARSNGSAAERRAPMPRTCFFDPLHGVSAKVVPLPGRPGTDVPVCSACANRVRRNDELAPLLVSQGDRLVPYYESGAEPWASTGYGALSGDLIQRVLTGT